MPKLLRCAALLGTAASLAVPASAAAAELTVDPSLGGAACQGTTCPTIQSAVDAASAGDEIAVLAGTYAESPSVGKGLTIRGAGAGDVKVTGEGAGDVFTLSAPGITLSGMTIDVPASGASAVAAEAADATLSGIVAQRTAGTAGSAPVIAVPGAAEIVDSFVVQGAGTGAAGVVSDGAGGVVLTDTLVVSSTGPALLLSESAGNRVVRSTLASTAEGAEGLRFAAADSAEDKQLVIDSSFVMAGPDGAALTVLTQGPAAGDVTVLGRHVTAVGATGAVLDASQAQGKRLEHGPSGNISATFQSSIVHGASVAREFTPTLPLLDSPNEASLTFARSDAPPASGNGTISMGGASHTDQAQLFAPGSLRLRADAPVIDKGGTPDEDESDKDVEGDPRVVGGSSDIGADEFSNRPPVAKFGIANPTAEVGQDVGFISGSSDPEQDAGGGIVEYRWDFGDGAKRTTEGLGVVHRYDRPGTYQVTLRVVDRQGAEAVSQPQTVTIAAVEPGAGPELAITVPAKGQRVKLSRKGKRRARRLKVIGSWADPQGIKSVEVSLRLVKKARRRGKAARGSAAQTKRCRFYSGRRITRKPCDQPVWVPAKIKGTGFRFRTRRGARLPAGRYKVSVRGTDADGNVSAAPSAVARTLVAFRIR